MDAAHYKELVERFSGCRTAAQCVALLAHLENVLSIEEELLSKKEILSLMQSVARLWGDLSRNEIFDQAEAIIGRLIEIDPEDAHACVLISEFYFYDRNEPDKALELAQDALSKAECNGSYLNLAAGNLARIATRLARYQLVASAMTKVLKHTSGSDIIDTKVETDFIARLPKGAISDQLIADYLAKAKSSRT